MADIATFTHDVDDVMELNTAEVLLGHAPSEDSLQPINPATWMQDFDRNTARPSTSRRVSCPTPNQRDDYVAQSPPSSNPNSSSNAGGSNDNVLAGHGFAPRKFWDRSHQYVIDENDSEGDEVESASNSASAMEDLSPDTLNAIIAVVRNVMNSSDEILKTYTRHQVIVALLMATNLATGLTDRQRIAIKMPIVMGRIAAAITNFRDATRAKA